VLFALATIVLAACGPGISVEPYLDASRRAGGGDARDDASTSDADVSVSDGARDSDARGDQSLGPDGGADGSADAGADVARDVAADSAVDRAADGAVDVTGEILTDRVDEIPMAPDVTARPDVSSDGAADTNDASEPPSDTDLDGTGVKGDADGIGIAGDADAGDGCSVGCDTECYVDANAQEGGDGSKESPFKTITACIELHTRLPGRARTAHVAAGTYDETLGEHFPLVLRGLSLEGAGQDQTFIRGSGHLDHGGEGGPKNSAYMLTMVVGDSLLPTRLSGLSVRPVPLVPTHGYYGVFCDQGNATGEIASPAGQTFVDRVKVGPGFDTAVFAVTSTIPKLTGCNMVVTRSTVTGVWEGLYAVACNDVVSTGSVLLEVGNSDPTSGNQFTWVQAQETRGGSVTVGTALTVAGCATLTSLQYNSFTDCNAGAGIGGGDPIPGDPRSPLLIRHNVFERLTRGGLSVGASLLFVEEISDNRFSAVSSIPLGQTARALELFTPYIGKVRRNVFVGNDIGVWIYPNAQTMDDFGRSDEPGGNVFRCNSRSNDYGGEVLYANDLVPPRGPAPSGVMTHTPSYPGAARRMRVPTPQDADGGDPDGGTPRTLRFVGNSWDHVPQRTGDFTAADGIEFRVDPNLPIQFDVSNSTLDNTPCPAGKIP